MLSKFESLVKKIIAEETGGDFDFINNDYEGPSKIIKVQKKFVYAYQLSTERDLDAIKDFKSAEGGYGPKFKQIGNWICFADVDKEVGRFWLVLDKKFQGPKGAYITPAKDKNDVIIVGGDDSDKKFYQFSEDFTGFTFTRYEAKPTDYYCFRLPTKFDNGKVVWGQEWNGGGYVFINNVNEGDSNGMFSNAECDVYERNQNYMQQ